VINEAGRMDAKTGNEEERNETMMTVRDVAKFLNVHPRTVYSLIKSEKLPAIRLMNKFRFRKEAVENWVRERETKNCS
jgi:excisionase family DNA binding protein